MGAGYFDPTAYDSHVSSTRAAGKSTFHYNSTQQAGSRKIHDDLNPAKVNSVGLKIREALDSADHPESTPIVVVLDVTGTMARVVNPIHASLKTLYALLLDKGYARDPQVMFMAIGDSSPGGQGPNRDMTDEIPLQAGQFESDIRTVLQLENMILEGGGGGQNRESYQNAAEFIAHFAKTDAWDKRGKKGYVFFIGDERNWENVVPSEFNQLTGETLTAPIPTLDAYRRLQERFETFFILPTGAANGGSRTILDHWRTIVGENVLQLEEANGAAQLIGTTIGLREDVVDLAQADKDMADLGVDPSIRSAVAKSLVHVGAGTAVAKTAGVVPGLAVARPGTARRL